MALDSEGFDLDAIPSSTNGGDGDDEVIYEIGGSATTISTKSDIAKESNKGKQKEHSKSEGVENSPIAGAEALKGKGNEQFKAGNYLDAYDYYTDAMKACPGMTGEEILQMKSEHEDKETKKANERYHRDTDRKRKPQSAEGESEDQVDESDDEEDDLAAIEFTLPPHTYGTKLAVYYSNRAACLLHLDRLDDAIADCDLALLLNPTYSKALVRRMTAYERTDQTAEALRDAKAALELDGTNREVRKHVARLQKVEDERMEKLKEETMGKLKDLGNSILGNFGLSLDNFNAQKDPSTGSYNISFGNN